MKRDRVQTLTHGMQHRGAALLACGYQLYQYGF